MTWPVIRAEYMLIGALFIVAAGLRIGYLNQPVYSLLPVREYRSALMSRSYYLDATGSADQWRTNVARINREREGLLEPPLMELMVANIYRLVGGEHLWVARLLSSLFWLAGGFFLYRIARAITSPLAAVFALAYYLFVPLGVRVSLSFHPDSLMMLFFLISLAAILWYFECPSLRRLLLAAGFSAVAVFVKPLVVFPILCGFGALMIYQQESPVQKVARTAMFTIVCLIPSAIYYSTGLFVTGFLTTQAQLSFRPELIRTVEYWRGWLLTGVSSVGYVAVIGALLGLPLIRRGYPRALMFGLVVGYIFFGLVFTYHIHTHGYYHLQLVPVLAIASGQLIEILAVKLLDADVAWFWYLAPVTAILVVLLFNVRDLRRGLASATLESPAIAAEIGNLVNHSTRTVYLAYGYGNPLAYYAELAGSYWYPPAEGATDAKQRYADFVNDPRYKGLGFVPEYYVITDLERFRKYHQDLKAYLNQNCVLTAETPNYLIYSNCQNDRLLLNRNVR